MPPRGKADRDTPDLIQVKIFVSKEDIELWHKYSRVTGYPIATTGRDFFLCGLMEKIAQHNKVMVWTGLLAKRSAELSRDPAPSDDS